MSESTQYIAKEHQKKRRKHKIKLAVSSIILMLIGSILIATNFMLNKNEYNGYKEKANVNYKVNLKENDFYSENYLDEKSTVIASLIKDIDVDFNDDQAKKIKLSTDENVKAVNLMTVYNTISKELNKK